MEKTKIIITEGIYCVNKPFAWTSFDVVNKMRYISKIKKIGHAGTLDPAATGVLVVCVGRTYTKQIDSVVATEKEYLAEITFGIETDSFDQEGKILSSREVEVNQDEIKAAMQQFVGDIKQTPPMFSAVHHQGKRLYEYARKGQEVKREAREVSVKNIQLEEYIPGENPKAVLRIVCSKGTYIRAIAHDLGAALGTGAYLSALIRTRVGEYKLDEAISIEQFISS